MNIGQAIKDLRAKKGYDQYTLAKIIKISQTSLSQIECNHKRPSAKNLGLICLALDVSLGAIYLKAIEEEDISKAKRPIFKAFKSVIDNILE